MPVGRFAIAAAALALLAGGCLGSGGGSGSSSAQQLTMGQFIQRAEVICKSYKKQIAALPTPTDLQKLADSGEKAVELQRKELQQLRRLRPPGSVANDVDEMLAGIQRGIDEAEKLIAAARGGDRQAVTAAATALQSELEAANRIARRLKLGECAVTA